MRILRAKPEEKWLVRRTRVEESIDRLIRCSGRAAAARPPCLAIGADEVASALEQLRVFGKTPDGPDRVQIPSLSQPPKMLTSKQRAATRRARGGRNEGIGEQHALASQAVEIRRFYNPVAICAGMRPTPIVGDRQHDVRLALGGESRVRSDDRNDRDQNERRDRPYEPVPLASRKSFR